MRVAIISLPLGPAVAMKNARKVNLATPVFLYQFGSNFAIQLKYLKHYFYQKCLQSQNQTVQFCFHNDVLVCTEPFLL